MTYVSCYYHAFQGAQQVGKITKKKQHPIFRLIYLNSRCLIVLTVNSLIFPNKTKLTKSYELLSAYDFTGTI